MLESQLLVFGFRLVSRIFQHPDFQTKIEQPFGGFFQQIKVRQPRKNGFYKNRDPNKQEVGFFFCMKGLRSQNVEVFSDIQN